MEERYLNNEKSTNETVQVVKQLDLLSKFGQAKVDGPEFMADALVKPMAVSMAFAGSETTAISLSSVFYFMLKNPETLRRLVQEIDDAGRQGHFSDYKSGIVTWAESQKLPYLDAWIKDGLPDAPSARSTDGARRAQVWGRNFRATNPWWNDCWLFSVGSPATTRDFR
jgi:cytochrome P450